MTKSFGALSRLPDSEMVLGMCCSVTLDRLDFLGQTDGHLATVAGEGPAVARCHIGLEEAGVRGLGWMDGVSLSLLLTFP